MLFTLGWNEAPRSAQALGGIFRWKDGRNMPDLHTVLFDYHGTPVYVRLGLGTETPELARFMGPKGILDANGGELRHSPQLGVDTYRPSYYSSRLPGEDAQPSNVKQWNAEHPATPGAEPAVRMTPSIGATDWDDLRPAPVELFPGGEEPQTGGGRCRLRQPCRDWCASHMANESLFP